MPRKALMSAAEPEREIARLRQALDASLAREADGVRREAAVSEVLRGIAGATDLQQILDVVAESAATLCDATDAVIFRLSEDTMVRVAHHGPLPTTARREFSLD